MPPYAPRSWERFSAIRGGGQILEQLDSESAIRFVRHVNRAEVAHPLGRKRFDKKPVKRPPERSPEQAFLGVKGV